MEHYVINSPTSSLSVVKGNISAHATPWFNKAVMAAWKAGVDWNVDPVVMIAQCALETGWGNFGGAVTPQHGNLAGIKILNPNDYVNPSEIHARFAIDPVTGIPWVGAVAQAHHLRLYAGLPVPSNTPDPRAKWIWPGTANFGSSTTVEALSGKWAPSVDYGDKIVTIMDVLTR